MKRFASSRLAVLLSISSSRNFGSSRVILQEKSEGSTQQSADATPSASTDSTTPPSAADRATQMARETTTRMAEDASKKNAALLDRAAALRREIYEIWSHPEDTWEEQRGLAEAVEAEKAKAAEAAQKDKSSASDSETSPIFGKFPNVGQRLSRYEKQAILARAFLDRNADIFDVSVPRDEDVTRALGEAFERLLLMQIPLPDNGASTTHLQKLLDLAGKNGKQINVKVVQHLFSRCSSYPEAVSLLYAMRYANINMSVDCYYAMIFSLQRLDEEAWCLRYREEAIANRKKYAAAETADGKKLSSSSHIPTAGPDAGVPGSFPLSAKALDFIVFGADNQLIPENKPWLGRGIMDSTDEFSGSAASPSALSGAPNTLSRNTTKDFDAMGAQWIRRLKNGQDALREGDAGAI